jgi:hypothetical protein
VPDTLPVHLSRSELHAVEVVATFETSGTFYVTIYNHGRDAHPHLKLDDDLARVASLGEPNPYVGNDEAVRVEVSVTPDPTPTTGRLKIETGYGATVAHVEVTIVRPEPTRVDVDETLGRPPGSDTDADADTGTDAEDDDPSTTVLRPSLALSVPSGLAPIGVLALAAVAVAGGTVMTVSDPVVLAGAAVVAVGVLIAGVLLLR